ncbi:hypothetical protein [Hymenobacter terrenus]|uniref:hypothetical protein n=1 Tax=Hymenobacter terrenus TaxID=1629124 RepID=UPI0006973EEE|nr:hypothetical protein [Hymenobacter terrenus]
MIDEKIKNYLDSRGIPRLSETGRQNYIDVLTKLGIPISSNVADFFLTYDEISFSGRSYQVFHICWSFINTYDYELLLKNLWERRPWGVLPRNYIPLSSFEGEKIFIYNYLTDSVSLVSELEINELIANQFQPQWGSLNSFLFWFFEVE